MFVDQQPIERLPQIPHQMEAVSHLRCLGGALTGAVGEGSATIPADHLDLRCLRAPMRGQPRGECRRLPVRQQVNHAMLFEIYQQRAVAQPAPEGEIIHAEQAQIRCDLADDGKWRATVQAQ